MGLKGNLPYFERSKGFLAGFNWAAYICLGFSLFTTHVSFSLCSYPHTVTRLSKLCKTFKFRGLFHFHGQGNANEEDEQETGGIHYTEEEPETDEEEDVQKDRRCTLQSEAGLHCRSASFTHAASTCYRRLLPRHCYWFPGRA